VKTGIADAIATQLGGLKGNRSAIAETIENNVRRKIIKEHLNDPAFYEKMSTLLDEIITARKAKAIEYEKYLKTEGFEVESIRMEDLTEMKEDLGIPSDMQSCHTTMVEEYFVEGHVPVEAIWKLLEEQPEIDGIALPGMPSGSPGMGGDKAEPFMIYSVVEGSVEEFMTL